MKRISYLAFTLLVTLAAAAVALEGCSVWPFEASREEGKLKRAIAEFRKAVKLEPDNVEAYRYLGLAYRLDGRLEKAIEMYKEVTKLDPGRAWPHLGLGDLYMDLGDVEKAIPEYQRAVALEPYNDEAYDRIMLAYDQLSLAYRLDGRLEKAIEVYEEATKVYPDKAGPYLGLGDLYMDLGDMEKAIPEYQRAVALEPYVIYGYGRVAQAYEALGDIEAALSQYLRAADIALGHKKEVKPYLEKAERNISENDLKAAESAIETARGVMPHDPHLLSLAIGLDLALMERYKAKGQMSAARIKAWDALLLDPKQKLALEMLTYYDFIANLGAAEVAAPEEPFPHVKLTEFTMPFNGDRRAVLFMFPEARISYRLKVSSEPSVLRFSLAMNPETWGWGGNGSTFEIYVTDEGEANRLLFLEHVGNNPEERRWHDREVSLAPYAGQEITITFMTNPGPGADFTGDDAGWATPRVMWARTEE